jgi:hypothetical protein
MIRTPLARARDGLGDYKGQHQTHQLFSGFCSFFVKLASGTILVFKVYCMSDACPTRHERVYFRSRARQLSKQRPAPTCLLLSPNSRSPGRRDVTPKIGMYGMYGSRLNDLAFPSAQHPVHIHLCGSLTLRLLNLGKTLCVFSSNLELSVHL